MNKYIRIALVAAFVVVPAAAQAFDISSLERQVLAAAQQAGGDAVAARDQALYRALDIADRFHVDFRPHERVCAEASAGEFSCDARVVTNGRGTPSVTNNVVSGYGPAQFLSAYGLSGTASSAKPAIIAIVDAYDDPNIAKDLATYSTQFHLPQLPACNGAIASSAVPCFQKVNQNGSATRHPLSNSGWALEISLDVETAHAICRNCSILLVEANSASYTNLMASVDRAGALGAKIVSNSYGSGEFSSETSYDSHFDHPGIAYLFSAGDSGYGATYPASSPFVTAVGGTSLFLNSDGSYNTELAWSGTGSGCSAYETKPAWQGDALCARRTVADVSADADPSTGAAVYDSVSYAGQRGWFQVGGTSLAAPIIAGAYALSGNLPTTTAENSLPYAAPAGSLHDVSGGANGSCGGSYLCTAVTGYDGPTGLGSPDGTLAF